MLATAAKARCTCACGAARVSGSRRQHIRGVNVNSEKVRKILTTAEPAAKAARMSANTWAQTSVADLRMLAQVEKWMAMIREISREQQSQPAFPR